MLARAPHDAVIVCAVFSRVPEPLVDQLRSGGRLVQPIGHGGQEHVQLCERRARAARCTAGRSPQPGSSSCTAPMATQH
ncbi:hypothetical protein ACIRP2_28870 [Streptomyces sp. NPDC101194]|uniref:hypothetical protein n=1 Tax=Streptomyces sp. NPDC101194 TaxID=3366127 RepID=UPI00382188DF